jgi:hypothetical protein
MEHQMKERPKDWEVKNGAFVGYVLVDVDDEDIRGTIGKMSRRTDGWLYYCADLRAVNEMKRRGIKGDEMDQTCLYHNGTLIGIVNAPMEALVPEWLKVRHVFDEPEQDIS